MNQKKLSILEFSRLTGLKRENLRFYDRIGLLSPETRGENQYRYYSRRQLSSGYLIGSLRSVGVGLERIKHYSEERSPEKLLLLIAEQDARMQEEILRLQAAREMMQLYADMAREALLHSERDFYIETRKAEPIFRCPSIPEQMDMDESGIFSYNYGTEKGVHFAAPLGSIYSQAQQEAGEHERVLCHYFKSKLPCNAEKPSGLYAVAWARCDPWQAEGVYTWIAEQLAEQGLALCGEIYEEYPLDDLAEKDPARFVIRVELPVRKIR